MTTVDRSAVMAENAERMVNGLLGDPNEGVDVPSTGEDVESNDRDASMIPFNETNLALTLHATDNLDVRIGDMIASIPQMTDDNIIDFAATASQMEKAGFKIRGACALEVKRRIAKAVAAGVKDEGGEGVMALMLRLSTRLGVDKDVIRQDCSIYEQFGDTDYINDPRLTREHYRFALVAPDPSKALDLALSKLDTPGYNTKQFRADVAALKGAGQTKAEQDAKTAELEAQKWVKAPVSTEAYVALAQMSERLGIDWGKVLTGIIIEAAERGPGEVAKAGHTWVELDSRAVEIAAKLTKEYNAAPARVDKADVSTEFYIAGIISAKAQKKSMS